MGALSAGAATVVFTTDGTSTGDLLDGIGTNSTNISVVEIPGLSFNIATTVDGYTLNANDGDFGVKSGLTGEVDDRFDFGETVLMSFDADIQITKIDFSNFDDGETFNFIVGSVTNSIPWADLSNKTSDYLNGISWNISAGQIIRLEVAGAGDSLSMDSLDITVVPEPAPISMILSNGLVALLCRRLARRYK
jgi:hypothetical protein